MNVQMEITAQFRPLQITEHDDLTENGNSSGQESVALHPKDSKAVPSKLKNYISNFSRILISFYHRRPKCAKAIIICLIAFISVIILLLVAVGPCYLDLSYSRPLSNFKLSWNRPFNVIFFGDSLIRNPSRGYNLLGRIEALIPQSRLNLIDMGEGGDKINNLLLRLEEVIMIYTINSSSSLRLLFLLLFSF